MDFEKKLNQIKDNLDKAKSLKIRADERLNQLEKQRDEILKELEALGVKPDDLEGEIKKLKEQIEELISRIEEMLPMDLIKAD